MNNLEKALIDETGVQLDFYLEDTGTKQIMKDIEEIKIKAAASTEAGKIKMELQKLADSI